MGEHQRIRTEDMATTSTSTTVSPQVQEEVERVTVITLRPTATQKDTAKKVVWTEDTVDNEHMNKKKSKCCCIYEKPRRFDESDSESSDEECEHCSGHVEKRHHHHQHGGQRETAITVVETVQETVPAEPTATLPLHPPEPSQPAPSDPAPPTS